ncbi:MAG: hypothetical protein FJ119_12780 [Deltaproteobacteria bacterium]|nr:hypothetical protein [Deltaproteobacteria bacterium]
MADGYRDYLAALNKGDDVSLVCEGAGMLMGSATVKDCVPLDNWIDNFVSVFIQKDLPGQITKKDKKVIMVACATILVTRLLQANDPAFFDNCSGEQLDKEIRKIPFQKAEINKIAAECFDYIMPNENQQEVAN